MKLLSGTNITLDVAANSTVAFIKSQIQVVVNVPIAEQRLTFESEQLKDMRTLAYYNIVKDTYLQMLSIL